MPDYFDISQIPGTNCYLDEAAYPEVRRLVSQCDIKDVHFLGSGNYHYLSYFFLERIKEDFCLLVIDNHPDAQAPAFSDILSCGSWVRKAASDFSGLKQAYICGASPEHVKEEEPFPDKISTINPEEIPGNIPADLPLYISLDKDVLLPEFAATDWDQGQMTLPELCAILESLKTRNILGMDICGDKKTEPKGSEITLNQNTDLALLKACPLS